MNSAIWDTYRQNAAAFALEWGRERDEKGEAHSFWDAFFKIFQLERRHFARHESRVKRSPLSTGQVGNRQGFIDLFWPGKLLVEHKSAHKDKPEDWAATRVQALEYIAGLPPELRPKKLILCNFRRFQIYDLQEVTLFQKVSLLTPVECSLADLPRQLDLFDFFPQFAGQIFEEEEKANLAAAERMGTLYEVLHKSGYRGHDLELLLVRILFCLFAEDTNIFSHKQFSQFIENYTLDSDVGEAIVQLFDVLNTPSLRRENLPESLRKFPYVNGGLFAEPLSQTPPSTMGLRNTLTTIGRFGWGDISPEIFGSLFQAVLSDPERRSLGAHYTSERNIRRLIDPLFMRELWAAFAALRHDRKKLEAFRVKIGRLCFLDPACGCGNFLVVTYRELRLLDLEVVRALHGERGQLVLDSGLLANVRLSQFNGLEIKPVSALIASVALWLTEHQCNRLLDQAFGSTVPTIPLDDAANIRVGNALQTDWNTLLPENLTTFQKLSNLDAAAPTFDYIIGNPPFSGSKIMSDEQREEIKTLFGNESGSGTLDYVTGWYKKAALYLDASPKTLAAFVSTNSIGQGEQVGMLWGELLEKHGLKIRFAHQTFKWTNEAPGMAAVYCVIVGFGKTKPATCLLCEYPDIKGEPIENQVKNINPYLVEAGDVLIKSRSKPICKVPEIKFGNQPIDGGFLLFEDDEKEEFLKNAPNAAKYIRLYVGSEEYIKGKVRWCLWLTNVPKEEFEEIPAVVERLDAVKKFRLESKRPDTNKLAATPWRFAFVSHTESKYVIIPSVSSERRKYVPIGFMPKDVIASNLCLIVPDADIFHFGVLTSEMHMAWMRYVCGRLKSDYRYSNSIVYNNFPFPMSATSEQKAEVGKAAQAVLDVRKKYQEKASDEVTASHPVTKPPSLRGEGRGGASLAQLYDPDKMPADLLAAHRALDAAVDACYGLKKPFESPVRLEHPGGEAKRVAFLFGLYEEMVKGESKNKR